jgi:hypothetical protein
VRREQLGITTSLNQFSRTIGGTIGLALLGAVLAAGLTGFPGDPNTLVNAKTRAQVAPQVVRQFQATLEHSLHNIFLACGGVLLLALIVAAATLRGGRLDASPAEAAAET